MTDRIARAIKVPVFGDMQVVNVPLDFDKLPVVIDADLIEIVRPVAFHNYFHESGDRLVMIVDESGVIAGKKLNHRAAFLYGTHVHNSPLAGDVLILHEGLVKAPGEDYEDMDLKALPESVTPEVIVEYIIAATAQRTKQGLASIRL